MAFSVFFIYLFTVTASINFYAYFCSFLAGAPFIKMYWPSTKRGTVQIVVLLTGFCVKLEKIIGKWKLPKCVSQLLINQARKDLSDSSCVRHHSNLGMLYFKYCIKEIKVSLRKCSTQIFDITSAIFFLGLWKARQKTIQNWIFVLFADSIKTKLFLKSISLLISNVFILINILVQTW